MNIGDLKNGGGREVEKVNATNLLILLQKLMLIGVLL
jgi:hypothetical protein